MTDLSQGDADLRLLRRAIAAAGELAVEHFRSGRRHWYKGPGQVLTQADLDVDQLLKEHLLGARPGDAWLSEETPDDGSRHERARVWMVDPIDGTRAFAEGVPEFSISIALLVDGAPALGAILNPATGEHFEAVRGGGAWLNGERITVSDHREIAGAHILSSRGEMKQRGWRELLPDARFRTVGSLAYKLALVASGRFDGLISLRRTHDWDVAAADLLIREAGGRLTAPTGEDLALNRPEPRHYGLVAGPPALHAKLVEQIAPLAERRAEASQT